MEVNTNESHTQKLHVRFVMPHVLQSQFSTEGFKKIKNWTQWAIVAIYCTQKLYARGRRRWCRHSLCNNNNTKPRHQWLIDWLMITYIALFSALLSTHCTRLWFYMSGKLFIARFLNIHRSGVLTALAWLVPHETAAISAQVLCTPYNHAPCHFMQSHIRKVYAGLAVTCTFGRMTGIFYVLLR